MTPALVKALIGLGATAAVGSGGYGIYYFATAPKNIRQKLEYEGLVLLNLAEGDTADKDEWVKKVAEHKKTEATVTDKFENLSLSDSDETTNINKLKKECKSVLDVGLSSEGVEAKLKQARKWCFKGTLSTA